jgi:hypothetical protein
MKRIDRALEMECDTDNDFLKDNIILSDCPQVYNLGPSYDKDSVKQSKYTGYKTGCRGITCEECWNQEIEE